MEIEDQTAQAVVKEVIDILEISEQEFGMTHQTLGSNPQTAEYVMAAQQGKLSGPKLNSQPSLSKQQTLTAFEISQRLTMEQMESLKNKKPPESGDQMEIMIQMMVEQAKMQDKMFFEAGVENEEFEDSLMYFVQKDPEVQKKMQEYMLKMRSQMGGMPGMGM